MCDVATANATEEAKMRWLQLRQEPSQILAT